LKAALTLQRISKTVSFMQKMKSFYVSKVCQFRPAEVQVNMTVNKACSQFCGSKILLSLDSGKLYFGATGIFPSHQNHLPPIGGRFTPKSQII
jgi:hypothetical protein